jgi:hypothetical protein
MRPQTRRRAAKRSRSHSKRAGARRNALDHMPNALVRGETLSITCQTRWCAAKRSRSHAKRAGARRNAPDHRPNVLVRGETLPITCQTRWRAAKRFRSHAERADARATCFEGGFRAARTALGHCRALQVAARAGAVAARGRPGRPGQAGRPIGGASPRAAPRDARLVPPLRLRGRGHAAVPRYNSVDWMFGGREDGYKVKQFYQLATFSSKKCIAFNCAT